MGSGRGPGMYLQSLVRPARGLGGAVAWICQSARCPGVDLSAPARPVRGSKLSKLPCARVGRGIALAGSIVRHGRCEAGKLTLNVNLDFKMAAQKFRISSPISACAGGVLAVVLRSGWLPARVCRAVRPRRARGPHVTTSKQFLWLLPGCLLGACWVAPGCLVGASWLCPGASQRCQEAPQTSPAAAHSLLRNSPDGPQAPQWFLRGR